jgi:hypothetical protein
METLVTTVTREGVLDQRERELLQEESYILFSNTIAAKFDHKLSKAD